MFREPQGGQCGVESMRRQLLMRGKGDGMGGGMTLLGVLGTFAFILRRRKLFEGFKQRKSDRILAYFIF